MNRFAYEIHQNAKGRFAIIRRLANQNVAGYCAVAHRHNLQRHYRIYNPSQISRAIRESRSYATEQDAREAIAQIGGR